MTKLPQLKSREIVKGLTRLGFLKTRQSGSHLRMIHPDGRAVTIPIHSKIIPKGTLNSILKQAQIKIEQLMKN